MTAVSYESWGSSQEESLFLDEAVAIGERLLAKRVFARDGGFTWLGLTGYGTAANPLRTVKLGPYLYDGTAGVALFLAAMERIFGGSGYGEAALRALVPLRRKMSELIADPERRDRLPMPIGGLIGIGSLIYSFLKIGEWLGEPELAQEGHQLTLFLTPERIALDERVRIQTGSAGAILALLALDSRHPEPNQAGRRPLSIAAECAAHLLDQRIPHETGPRVWRLSPDKPPLGDFGYGTAGIVYALLRLNEREPNGEIRQAVEEGLAFINSLYSPEHESWRDVRADFEALHGGPEAGTWRDWWASGAQDPMTQLNDRSRDQDRDPLSGGSRESFPSSWCHGSAGIALGGVAALDLSPSPGLRAQEVIRALERLRRQVEVPRFAEQGADDLCCGHMGRIEVLLEAALRLQNPRLLDTARSLATRLVLRGRTDGRYRISAARGSRAYSPALFQGEAGIGYTLLRLARPESLPCLLLLD